MTVRYQHVFVAILLLAIFMAQPALAAPSFAYQVAARCKGEASFAISGCACSVRNRLAAGWVQHKVLSAYYAPDVTPTAAEVELVRGVLDGTVACDPRLYFMYSYSNVVDLGLTREPVLKVVHGRQQIWFFSRK